MGSKNNDNIFLHCQNKTVQTFDIVLIHRLVLFYSMVLTTRTKVGMIRQNFNLIDEINFSAEAKRFTYDTMQRNIIMSILRQSKK